MPINGKTADQMREEFYEALRREREERDAAFREERAERLEAGRRFEEEMRQRQIERDRDWKKKGIIYIAPQTRKLRAKKKVKKVVGIA